MNILAIDTSGPVCGVAVLKNNAIAYEGLAVNRMTHSASLVPMIDEALTRTEITLAEMDYLAAVTGPGSFTGVRIGVSTVKGLAHGASKPCIGVNALEALAYGISLQDALLCPIQDARAGQVYGAAFWAGDPPRRVLPDAPVKLETFVEQALSVSQGKKLCFTGDGLAPYRAKLTELLGERAILPKDPFVLLRPGCAALSAMAQVSEGKVLDYLSLMPVYLRPASAVMLKDRKTEGRP